MNIREFSFNLQKLYEEMGTTFSSYQLSKGLPCFNNCGRCCQNPDIEASILEMIPMALRIYDEGKLDEWLIKLEENQSSQCILFTPHSEQGFGSCSSYGERPVVCRIFGVAGTLNKRREIIHSICKHIREDQPQKCSELEKESNSEVPLISTWMAKIANIDPDIGKNFLPINKALRGALEKIAFYAQYQEL